MVAIWLYFIWLLSTWIYAMIQYFRFLQNNFKGMQIALCSYEIGILKSVGLVELFSSPASHHYVLYQIEIITLKKKQRKN